MSTEEQRRRWRETKRRQRANNPTLVREKERSRRQRWREKHPDTWQQQLLERDQRQQARHRAAMDALKTTSGCADCGRHDGPLLFHHVDGGTTKLFNIADAWNRSKRLLAAELAKCAVLCPRCHTGRHAALDQ